MFLSASNVTLSPAFTSWLVAVAPNSPALVAADVAVHAALLIASTTLLTVAILFSSPVFATTVPAVLPSVTLLIVPVLTVKPVSPVLIVVLSVLTFKPSSVTSKDLSAFFTATPASDTSKDLSPAFTVILLSLFFSKPSPVFTLYFTVDVVPSFAVATATEVPSPSMKFTVSYGFTKSFATPFSCKFQPAFNTSPTVAALFLFT